MQRRERENLPAVLESAGWKIKGADGAAELLGSSPPPCFADEENGAEAAPKKYLRACLKIERDSVAAGYWRWPGRRGPRIPAAGGSAESMENAVSESDSKAIFL